MVSSPPKEDAGSGTADGEDAGSGHPWSADIERDGVGRDA